MDVEKTDINQEEDVPAPKHYFGVRHIQIVFLFFGILLAYGMRSNLSVGVVAMTDNTTSSNPDVPVHPEWEDKKEIMSSAFFWGYVMLQIGAGQLAEKYGPKLFLCISMSISSLFAILIPVFSEAIGYEGVIVCRVFQGLSQGFLYPSVHNLLSHWSSVKERAKVATFTYSGGPLGAVISNLATGSIASSWAGWPVAFYLYGGLGIAWSILFWFIGAESPDLIKYISDEEKRFIEAGSHRVTSENQTKLKTPWKSIFTSLPLWATFVAHSGQNWGFWTLMTEIPTYLNKRLDYDMKSNAFLSAAPYLALFILSLVMSPIADFLIIKKYITRGASRKIFNSIGLLVPSLAMIILAFVDKSQKELAIFLLILAVGSNAAVLCGFNVNHMDLSPNFAGTLMGITNSVSNILSIVAPLSITGLKNSGYKEENADMWQIVFCVAAGFGTVGGVFFALFGSGEVQPWNEPKQ